MTDFLMMTMSFVVAMLVTGVIGTVAAFALMSNTKVMNWLTKYYMNQIEKTVDNFNGYFDDVHES